MERCSPKRHDGVPALTLRPFMERRSPERHDGAPALTLRPFMERRSFMEPERHDGAPALTSRLGAGRFHRAVPLWRAALHKHRSGRQLRAWELPDWSPARRQGTGVWRPGVLPPEALPAIIRTHGRQSRPRVQVGRAAGSSPRRLVRRFPRLGGSPRRAAEPGRGPASQPQHLPIPGIGDPPHHRSPLSPRP